MTKPVIKVCGLRNADNIRAVEALGVDYHGFILHPASKRYVAVPPAYMGDATKRVGVFVNEEPRRLLRIASLFGLTTVQLHGDETPDYCRDLAMRGVKVFKAFNINRVSDFSRVAHYAGCVDFAVFDTGGSALRGGTGRKFDWSLLDNYTRNIPFLLSGGIGPDDAQELLKLNHPMLRGFDLNSRFELEPALKDVDRLAAFLTEIRGECSTTNTL
jgi:phosphoribosylanthranilate isomerase